MTGSIEQQFERIVEAGYKGIESDPPSIEEESFQRTFNRIQL